LTIIPNVETLNWKLDQFRSFLPADDYEVFGFTVRNRTPGLGLPLIAVINQSLDAPNGGALPITALLRMNGGLKELGSGMATATLELYSAYDQVEVTINGRVVPLEADSTAPLAYRLNDPAIWSLDLKRFRGSARINTPMVLIQPYEPGRIPVVFVHGTVSSPLWWAEMVNTLRSDPVIRNRFQFWFFQYDSSRIIALSAAELRETLTDMLRKLDPEGKDPALRQMVVVGHSQGGLLTKMSAVAPGDRIWKSISDQSIDEMEMTEEIKEMARRIAFYEPLPFVKRVVFISTPHRGSFLTKNWVRNLVRALVSIPVDIITLNPQRFIQFTDQLKLPPSMRNRIPSSVDGMSSDNPVLQTLVTIPLAPGVKGHSIIAVLPGMEIKTGDDGVVEYQSAHIEGVESEFIVRSGHSCQQHPFTIEEVRRILHEHIGDEVVGPGEIHALNN
jgi:pimeloyl-ACP methyl ester carboxylesterase